MDSIANLTLKVKSISLILSCIAKKNWLMNKKMLILKLLYRLAFTNQIYGGTLKSPFCHWFEHPLPVNYRKNDH
jgi:hypothetical protein